VTAAMPTTIVGEQDRQPAARQPAGSPRLVPRPGQSCGVRV